MNVYVSTPTTSPSVLVTAAADAGDGSAAEDGADELNEMVPMLGLHDDVDEARADQQRHAYLTDGTCFGHDETDMLENVENALPEDSEPRHGNVEAEDGTGSAAVCSGDQSGGVASSSSGRPAGARCQALSAVNVAAYVPLPQLIDHISPYTAVDTSRLNA